MPPDDVFYHLKALRATESTLLIPSIGLPGLWLAKGNHG